MCNPALGRQTQKNHTSNVQKFEAQPEAMLVPRTPDETPLADLQHSSEPTQLSQRDPTP